MPFVRKSTCRSLGLARQLTIGDARYWISCIVGGAHLDRFPIGPRADCTVAPVAPARSVIDDCRTEIDTSNRVLDAMSLDDPPLQRGATRRAVLARHQFALGRYPCGPDRRATCGAVEAAAHRPGESPSTPRSPAMSRRAEWSRASRTTGVRQLRSLC